MSITDLHYAQYGNTLLKRAYCKKCRRYAFVIDDEIQCCGDPVQELTDNVRMMVSPNGVRRGLGKERKQQIIADQDNKCFYCKEELGYYYKRAHKIIKSTVHFDHIIPFSFSYDNNHKNFVASCNLCNLHKSDKMYDDIQLLRQHLKEVLHKKGIEIVYL